MPTPPEVTRTPDYQAQLSRVAGGAGITLVGSILGTGFSYLFNVWAGNALGPSGFGDYCLVLAVASVTATVCMLGLDTGMLRFIPIYGRDRARVRGVLIVALATGGTFGLVAAGIYGIFAEGLTTHLFRQPHLAPLLRWISLLVPGLALSTILTSATRGFKKAQYRVYVEYGAGPLVRLLALGVLLAWGWRSLAPVGAEVIGCVIEVSLAAYFLFRLFRLFPWRRQEERTIYEPACLLKFSLPLVPARFLNNILTWSNTLLLGYLTGHSAQVGIFNAAQRTSLLGRIVLVSFNAIFPSAAADLYARGEIKQLEALFKTATRWSFSASWFIFLLFALLAHPIVEIFGRGFHEAAIPLIILGFGQFINGATGPCGFLISMCGRSDVILYTSLLAFGLNVGLNFLLIPQYGAGGAAVASALALMTANLIRLVLVHYLFGIHPYDQRYWKGLAAGLVAALGLILAKQWIAPPFPWFACAGLALLFGSIFFLCLWRWGLEEEDRHLLQRLRQRVAGGTN